MRHLKLQRYWQTWLICSAIVIMGLRLFLGNESQIVETWYSRGIYPYIQGVFAIMAKILFFFSVGETVVLLCLSLYAIYGYKLFQKWKNAYCRFFVVFIRDTCAMLCGVYIVFNVLWGFNYLRKPLYQHMKISIAAMTEKDVIRVAKEMLITLNELENCKFADVALPDKVVNMAMNNSLSHIYASPNTPPPTKYFISNEFMNAAAISGIFLPFFMEPHINAKLLPWERPFVMAHEKAHFYGFASETDANLIAYIACMSSKEEILRYSAALRIFISCARYMRLAKWQELFAKLSLRSQQDIREWQQRLRKNRKYYAFLNDISRQVNDTYLKLNSQQLGVLAYGAALPQFVLWWKQYKLK